MDVTDLPLGQIIPYARNPRRSAVDLCQGRRVGSLIGLGMR